MDHYGKEMDQGEVRLKRGLQEVRLSSDSSITLCSFLPPEEKPHRKMVATSAARGDRWVCCGKTKKKIATPPFCGKAIKRVEDRGGKTKKLLWEKELIIRETITRVFRFQGNVWEGRQKTQGKGRGLKVLFVDQPAYFKT